MLPSLTVVFLAGLCIGSFIPFFPLALLALLLAVALALTLGERLAWIDSRHAAWLYAALLAGCLYWTLDVPTPSDHQPPPSRRDAMLTDVVGRIEAPVQHAPGRRTVVLAVERVTPAPVGLRRPDRIKLVWREPDTVLLQGDRVALRAKLHAPSGTLNPGGFDYAGYLERQGIDAVATVTGPEAVRVLESGDLSRRWAVWHSIDRWRATIRDAAIKTLNQPALGLFLGIIIGERGYLAQEVQEWFMATGTVHLLSISGSHLGLVALVGFWLVKRAALALPVSALLTLSRVLTPSRIAMLLTWPLVLLYALLAGAELATIRSLIMITLAFVALWLGHERRLHHALAAAALLIVVHDPRAIYDLSFQLSFLSVLVIVHVLAVISANDVERTPEPAGLLKTLAGSARDALLMSGAVTLATFPVVAYYFNQVPWMGIVTNLFAIPVTGFVLVPVGLLSAVWTGGTGADSLAFGPLQETLSDWFIQGLRWCADLPGSQWHVSAPAVPSVVVFYAALWLAGGRGISKPVRLCSVTAVVCLAVWWIWSPRVGLDGDRWRVTFLDVGQGDSAVVELPDGKTVLIDGGARYERFDMGRSVVGPFLWNRGIRRLDHVIGTHPQLDHVGGLVWLLRHIDVGRYWSTGEERQEQFFLDLQKVLREEAIPEQPAAQGDEVLPTGPCRLTILNPTSSAGARPVVHSGSWLNNQSIVSRLQCGTQAILFAADIEVDGLRRLTGEGSRPVTVVKVPHHGAKSSLDLKWISELHPRYAVVSVGRSNSYGHPVQAVLDAYALEQAAILRTDRDGAIWVSGRVSSAGLALTRARDLLLQPVEPGLGAWPGERENWRRLLLQLRDFHSLPFAFLS
jgi:competence protein ComEC